MPVKGCLFFRASFMIFAFTVITFNNIFYYVDATMAFEANLIEIGISRAHVSFALGKRFGPRKALEYDRFSTT